MPNYCACIEKNIVSRIIVADYAWVTENLEGEWIDLGSDPLVVGIGYTYDSLTNDFTPPPTQP